MNKPNKPYKHYEDLSFLINVKIYQLKEVNSAKTPPLQIMLYHLSGYLYNGKHADTVDSLTLCLKNYQHLCKLVINLPDKLVAI